VRALVAASKLAVRTLAAFALCHGLAHPQSELAGYQGADRMERLLAAAKKEGSFTLYTSFAEKDLPTIIPPFEKKYGVKVRVWRASSVTVLQRTVSEAAARRHEVDAVLMSAPEMEALHREKLLQPVSSPNHRDLVAGAVPAHREWVAPLLSVWVQAYNTNAVKKEDLPRSFRDLLDPKWKGRIGIEADDAEWLATIAQEMGEAQGLAFFRELAQKNGVSVRRGHTLLNNLVVSGEVPLALTVYNYMPEGAKKKGAPIDWIALEPLVARPNGVGVALRAPNPGAALLFYEYMLSDAQDLLVSMDYVPANSKTASPLKNLRIKVVDAAVMLDQRDKWTKAFDSIFVRR
jgi:iron(III) transport system substrate-binding protein